MKTSFHIIALKTLSKYAWFAQIIAAYWMGRTYPYYQKVAPTRLNKVELTLGAAGCCPIASFLIAHLNGYQYDNWNLPTSYFLTVFPPTFIGLQRAFDEQADPVIGKEMEERLESYRRAGRWR